MTPDPAFQFCSRERDGKFGGGVFNKEFEGLHAVLSAVSLHT